MSLIFRSLIRFTLVLALSVVGWSRPPAPQAADLDIPVDEVLSQVQAAIGQVQSVAAKEGLPPQVSVTLSLQTESKKVAGGIFKLFIVSWGRKKEWTRTQELVLELRPPSPTDKAIAAQKATLAQLLVNAMLAGVRGAQAARDRNPPLELARLRTVTSFIVSTETTGGLSFELLPLTADLKGEFHEKMIHKVTVEFSTAPR